MKTLKGYEQIVLGTQESKDEFLMMDKENTRVFKVPASKCRVCAYSSPLEIMSDISRIGDDDFGIADAEIYFNSSENCMVLQFEYESKLYAYPVGHTAYAPMLTNTEADAPIMYRFNKMKRNGKEIHPLSLEDRCRFLNNVFEARGLVELTIILKKNEIVYVGSENYTHLPAYEGEAAFVKELMREHKDTSFDEAICSNENMVFHYSLNDEIAQDSLLLKFNEFGITADKLVISAQFATSDSGYSCMTGSLFYQMYKNGQKHLFITSTPRKAKHYGENTIEKFAEDVKKMVASIDELEEIIEKLGNTDVKFPAGLMYHLLKDDAEAKTKKCIRSLRKSDVDNLIQMATLQFPDGANIIDIYMLINDSIINYIDNNENVTKILNLYEEIAGLLYCDFERYDIPVPTK